MEIGSVGRSSLIMFEKEQDRENMKRRGVRSSELSSSKSKKWNLRRRWKLPA